MTKQKLSEINIHPILYAVIPNAFKSFLTLSSKALPFPTEVSAMLYVLVLIFVFIEHKKYSLYIFFLDENVKNFNLDENILTCQKSQNF